MAEVKSRFTLTNLINGIEYDLDVAIRWAEEANDQDTVMKLRQALSCLNLIGR